MGLHTPLFPLALTENPMFYPLAVYIGWRYTRAKRRNHFISFISLSSMIGMALGITALITVLSVMNGFQQEIRSRILHVTAHASIVGIREPLADWPTLQAIVREHPQVEASAPFVYAEGMVSRGGRVSGAVIQGILPEDEVAVSEIDAQLVKGELAHLKAGEFGLIIGSALAEHIGAVMGDSITVITPPSRRWELNPVFVVLRSLGSFIRGCSNTTANLPSPT